MSKVFSPHSREWFGLALGVAGVVVLFLVAATTYYATPAYARVGYEPVQPIRFSHRLHAGDLGLDCRYCHSHVEESRYANIPGTQVCLTCHGAKWGNIKADSAALAPLREAETTGRPVRWRRVHRVPDFAYFHHAVHVRRGVSCVSCHGRVDRMDVVRHEQPLTMSWCLDCHRNPRPHLRPADRVTDLGWTAKNDPLASLLGPLLDESDIRPPTDCSGCHR